MNCTLTFTIGEKKIEIHYEGNGSYPSSSEIIKILQASDQWNDIKNELMPLVESMSPKRVKLKYEDGNLKDASGQDLDNLIPNVNLAYLKREFPYANFPETIDGEVLLIDNVSLPNGIKFGRNLLPNGKVLYITNKHNVQQLAKFFSLVDKLKNFKIKSDSEIANAIQEIGRKRFKDKKERSTEDILFDFTVNKSKYSSIPGVSLYMQNLLREIDGLEVIKSSNNDTINDLKGSLTWTKNSDGKWYQQIKPGTLYKILKNSDEKLSEVFKALDIKSSGANFSFQYKLQSKLTDEEKQLPEIQALGIQEFTSLADLISKYLNIISEGNFSMFINTVTKDYVSFKSSFNVMGEFYGEDTINALVKINSTPYLGYNVYAQENKNGKIEYFITKYRMDANSEHIKIEVNAKEVSDTIPEIVKQTIENRVKNEDIATNSMIEFKSRLGDELDLLEVESFRYVPEKSIIRVIDSPVVNYDKKNSQFNNTNEYKLVYKHGNRIKDFQNYINEWTFAVDPNNPSRLPIDQEIIELILQDINTPEKISLFLHKLNELTNTSDRTAAETQQVNLAINEAKKTSYKYYFVESTKSNKTFGDEEAFKHKYSYKLIPVKQEVLQEYKSQPKEPSIKFMQAIHKSFEAKFNVNINIQNSDELFEKFGENFMNAKAFIKDDEIYINSDLANSEDLFHEYTHLLLGVLKNSEKTRSTYEQLLNIVAQTEKGARKFKTLSKIYGDTLSTMSIREEVFANLFSEYLTGTSSNEITDIFRMNGSVLKEGTELIFDTTIKSEKEMIDFYGSSLNTVFKKFSRDVAQLLSNDSSFLSVNKTRKQASYIDNKIKSGEIKEDCK